LNPILLINCEFSFAYGLEPFYYLLKIKGLNQRYR